MRWLKGIQYCFHSAVGMTYRVAGATQVMYSVQVPW